MYQGRKKLAEDLLAEEEKNQKAYHDNRISELEAKITVTTNDSVDDQSKDWELDDIIVHGYGNQPFARDFYSRTEERLIDTKDHVEAMKEGLQEKGYKIK